MKEMRGFHPCVMDLLGFYSSAELLLRFEIWIPGTSLVLEIIIYVSYRT